MNKLKALLIISLIASQIPLSAVHKKTVGEAAANLRDATKAEAARKAAEAKRKSQKAEDKAAAKAAKLRDKVRRKADKAAAKAAKLRDKAMKKAEKAARRARH